MSILSSLFGKSAKFTSVVTIRKFSKNDPPKAVSITDPVKIRVSPDDVALPMHGGGARKKLRKSPAVKKGK